jgi:hypothetical protein
MVHRSLPDCLLGASETYPHLSFTRTARKTVASPDLLTKSVIA